MPLFPGRSRKTISANIGELHTGQTYAHTAAKFGKPDADRQAVAIAMSEARKSRENGGRAGYDDGGVPPLDYGRPQFRSLRDVTLPPEAGLQFARPGRRPTEGIAATPQSADEERDLADSIHYLGGLGRIAAEASGLAPAYRSVDALREGEPLLALGHAGLAAMPYSRALGLGLTGGAYGIAAGQTFMPGAGGRAEAEEGAVPAQFIPMSRADYFAKFGSKTKSLQELQTEAADRIIGSKAYQGLVEEGQHRRADKMLNDARAAAAATFNQQQAGIGSEETRLGNAYTTYREELARARDELLRGTSTASERERAIRDAERARAEWEGKDVQWKDTPIGQFDERLGGYGPAVAAAGFGGLSRAAAMTPIGRHLLGEGHVAHWGVPIVTGGFAGATANNIPQIYNMNQTDVLNPRRRALEEYAERLPADHPRRAETLKRLENTITMPVLNPVQQQAMEQLTPGPIARRSLSGFFLEGLPGGFAGAESVVLGDAAARGIGRAASRLRGRGSQGATGDTLNLPGGTSAGGPGGRTGPSGTGDQGGLATLEGRGPPPPRPVAPDVPPVPVGGLPSMEARARDPNYSIPASVLEHPVAPGEIETWVSRNGSRVMTRDATGNLRQGSRWHGKTAPKNYRRIASMASPDEPVAASGGHIAQRGSGPNHKDDTAALRFGGRVGPAYAMGGVVAGPVVGQSPGRADNKPVDVAGGSYVLPADVVAACGDGNTEAGHAFLGKRFGAARPRAEGGAVPIMISDGEHVLDPAQVTAFGRGDHAAGCRALDQFVKDTRRRNIAHLKSLPGPAKG